MSTFHDHHSFLSSFFPRILIIMLVSCSTHLLVGARRTAFLSTCGSRCDTRVKTTILQDQIQQRQQQRPLVSFIARRQSSNMIIPSQRPPLSQVRLFSSSTTESSDESQNAMDQDDDENDDESRTQKSQMRSSKKGSIPPSWSSTPIWSAPYVKDAVDKKRKLNKTRFRQHVNPLALQYQQGTILPDNWPGAVLENVHLPLHLDIGCSKGGFLIDLASHETQNRTYASDYNYLGLEIRPLVAQFAKDRIPIHNCTGILEFVGCNANVDLDRLLSLYHQASAQSSTTTTIVTNNDLLLQRVTIQFPDPHFKSAHAKRRVVKEQLVDTLAKYMPADSIVFLQSDVQNVLDDMRQVFGNCTKYFNDNSLPHEYMPENILGVATEREISVLKKDLPVYRAVFYRTETKWQEMNEEEQLQQIEMEGAAETLALDENPTC
eukprot:CAMPEP_0198143906 /NCGR_PEP_ID=MMETSP1443-20131203/11572_1 /TAXON_ID=186043 /ORGANISM="Entomoneis sp., Strain CCMP2396" /LENGTH=433 /DNA_ID=CAMNT_0043807211 /DNA_START=45 /DNA_END=1349 /DNA_ORIENTATION=-